MSAPAASVVLVEDSAPYARLVALLLESTMPGGVEVRHHERLAGAVADLRERDADCVLLDLTLPDAQGLEGLAALRSAGVGAPIIVLSGHDDDELAVDAIAAGAQDYLVKGQERLPQAFVRVLRFAIARRRVQERTEDLLRAKEDRWRTITHLAPVGIVETDADGQCVFANDWFGEIAGRPRELLLGMGWREAMHEDDRMPFDLAWRAAADGDDEFSLEIRFCTPEREVRWAHLTAVLLRDPWGAAAGWLGTMVDVTSARRAREDLHAAEQELRRQQADVLAVAALARDGSLADDAVAPLVAGGRALLGADLAVLFVDDGAGGLLATAADGTVLPDPPAVALDGAPSGAAACRRSRERVEVADAAGDGDGELSAAFVAATGARTLVFEPLLRAGDVVGVLAVGWRRVVAPVDGRASTVVGLLAAELGAALERRRLLDQLRDLARTDPLTGLANRRLWDERLAIELARAARYGRPLCVAALDLDNFKPYNDRHGHQAGDLLLRRTTAAWQDALRGSDLLSRLGGDEFGLLLPDCDVDGARHIVARLQAVTAPADDGGIACSAGLACWAAGESAAQLLARADAALYAAKAGGRGGISVG